MRLGGVKSPSFLSLASLPRHSSIVSGVGPQTWSRSEFAARTGLPESLLAAVENAGLIEPVQIDGDERYTASDVELRRTVGVRSTRFTFRATPNPSGLNSSRCSEMLQRPHVVVSGGITQGLVTPVASLDPTG